MAKLEDKTCVACGPDAESLGSAAIEALLRQLGDWQLNEQKHLSKQFTFADFRSALAFVNRIGEVAETEGHHPDLTLGWGKVGVELFTHDINGLSENDFIVAAKIDAAL